MSLDASFPALYGYTCRQVLDIHRRGPLSVSEIETQVNFCSRSNISQILARLLKAELVSVRRQGRNHIYQLRPERFEELARYCRSLARDARRNR